MSCGGGFGWPQLQTVDMLAGRVAGVGDYRNQWEAEQLARQAQEHAIGQAFAGQDLAAGIGGGIARQQYGAQQGAISNWQADTAGAIEDWYSGWQERGGMAGQVQPVLDQYGAQVRGDVNRAEAGARGRAGRAIDRLETQQGRDRDRVLMDARELARNVQESIQYNRSEYRDIEKDFENQVTDALTGVTEIKDFLSKGVSSQIAGAVGALQTQKSQALAQFDAQWTGPRDQRYAAARSAVESQYNNQAAATRNEKQEAYSTLAATTLTAAHDSVNDLRAAGDAARGQAFYGVTQEEAENLGTLGKSAGDVAQFMADQEKVMGDTTASLLNSVNDVYIKGMDVLNDASQYTTDTLAKALQMDEATRATYSDLLRTTADAALANISQAEAAYSSNLFAAMDRSSAFAQMGVDMTFNQNFGVPLLSPATQTWFNQDHTMWSQGYAEDQLAFQRQQLQNQTILGALGVGTRAVTPFIPEGGLGGGGGGVGPVSGGMEYTRDDGWREW